MEEVVLRFKINIPRILHNQTFINFSSYIKRENALYEKKSAVQALFSQLGYV